MGRLVCLLLVEETNLTCFVVHLNGTDDCHICFAVQEYAICDNACQLDSMLLMITQVFLPNFENMSMRALYHCNHGFAYTKTVNN